MRVLKKDEAAEAGAEWSTQEGEGVDYDGLLGVLEEDEQGREEGELEGVLMTMEGGEEEDSG